MGGTARAPFLAFWFRCSRAIPVWYFLQLFKIFEWHASSTVNLLLHGVPEVVVEGQVIGWWYGGPRNLFTNLIPISLYRCCCATPKVCDEAPSVGRRSYCLGRAVYMLATSVAASVFASMFWWLSRFEGWWRMVDRRAEDDMASWIYYIQSLP